MKPPDRDVGRPKMSYSQSERLTGAVIWQLSPASPPNPLHPQNPAPEKREPVPDWGQAGHPREGGIAGVKALGSISVVRCNKIFYGIFTILCNGISKPQKKTLRSNTMQLSRASPAGEALSPSLLSSPLPPPLLQAAALAPHAMASPGASQHICAGLCACHILPQ